MLGKLIKRAGYRQDAIFGTKMIGVLNWYESLRQLIGSVEKSVYSFKSAMLIYFIVLFADDDLPLGGPVSRSCLSPNALPCQPAVSLLALLYVFKAFGEQVLVRNRTSRHRLVSDCWRNTWSFPGPQPGRHDMAGNDL
ncbi:hypothetical protein [Paenibacillus caui]|uniref:hypothetical protein n=1 Tax=Paenibacillus caui TaxID=2873927 RepID=UPI001CAA019E|nr:hypothetical protein [Paenibacillus caui]